MSNDNFDWKEVEDKISIICRKFENLGPWHEDLAQELRVHAYYVSNNYYDLYRKAIDFWRKVQTKQSPEVPYFDLDILGQVAKKEDDMYEFDRMVKLVERELNRPGYNKCDEDKLRLSRTIWQIVLEDIDPRRDCKLLKTMNKSDLSHYFNQRLNLTWVSEETGVGYKRVAEAMRFIEDTIRGLSAMHKIEIPIEYFRGYYDR